MKRTVRSTFIMGIIAILPIGLTFVVVWFLIAKIGGFFSVIFKNAILFQSLPSYVISLIGFIFIVAIIYLIGIITSSYIGRHTLKFGERMIERLPFIRTIYTSARRFTNAVFLDKGAFRKVVLIEYPRKGTWTLAFMTNESTWKIDKEYINVFVPTSPNPTSGFYIIYPKGEAKETDLSVDEAFRTIISGGVILPENRNV